MVSASIMIINGTIKLISSLQNSSLSDIFHMMFFFFKQKTAYEMRISDWSSDVCSSDLSRERVKDMASDYPRDRDAEIRAFADRRGLSGEIRLPERAERSPVEILGPRAGTMRQMGEDPRTVRDAGDRGAGAGQAAAERQPRRGDRKSKRLNSSH